MPAIPPVLRRAIEGRWLKADRDYRERILGLLPRDPDARLLDLGCDDGEWTSRLAAAMGIAPDRVTGLEVVASRRELALARGFDVVSGDLESAWPFEDGSFEVVHANQVIEHVKRLDHFASEARRVLAPGGTVVICTENLASWPNVAAVAMGWMPFSLTNITRLAIGNPLALHIDEERHPGESWQHVHVLTPRALHELFERHGFVVERAFGAGWFPAIGRLESWLSERRPQRAHFIGIRARAV